MTVTIPHRILVAPSGFKESMAAEEAAEAIAAGIRRACPAAHLDQVPLVDGGEGSARTLAAATSGRVVPVTATGPTGESIESHIAVLGGEAEGTVVVEMAAVAGLALVPRDHRDPGLTTTYGVGELIAAALDHSPRTILIGCGDSGTCDGGAGALQALGARITDASGAELERGGYALSRAAHLDLSGLDPRLEDVEIRVACNPFNVLTGDRGVARVFGPQKGADPEQVSQLAEALDCWAEVLTRDGRADGVDLRTGPGTGASGGLGAGLAAGLGAALLPRFDVLLDHVDLDSKLASADLVITAEGAVDFQTSKGKVPAEVARRAKRCGLPVLVLAGTIGERAREVYDAGVDAFVSILPAAMDLEEAMEQGPDLLADAAEQLMRTVLVGCVIGTTGMPRR
jgi:glycerate kinase